MKYLSIDSETGGLNPRTDSILELSMVLEDTDHPEVPVEELPHYTVRFRNETLVGNFYAFEMNRDLLQAIHHEGAEALPPPEAWEAVRVRLINWGFGTSKKSRVTVAGKNVGSFDLQFFPPHIRKFFHHRCVDPGSVFVDWGKDQPPGLKDLLNHEPAHTSLEDARDVIRVLRAVYDTVRVSRDALRELSRLAAEGIEGSSLAGNEEAFLARVNALVGRPNADQILLPFGR